MQKDIHKILSHTVMKGDCLIWQRCYNTDGYPRAVFNGNNNGKVHRVVWELWNNKSADGYVVRHKCDNPKCINPNHLEIGTASENIKDRTIRSRHGAAKLDKVSVKMIRDLYKTEKYTQKELAEKFSVHVNTVNSLINRNHWKSVD